MDLTFIRDRVYRQLLRFPNSPKVDAFDIDDAVNYVQDTYIQLAALKEGFADYITTGEQTITGEKPKTTDNTTYTAAYKPFKYGTVTVYVDEEKKEDGFTINCEDGTVVFGAATTDVTIDYTAHEVIDKADLASDIYKIEFIRDITNGLPGTDVAFVSSDDTLFKGVQETDGKLYFREIKAGSVYRFYYWKKLPRIGTAAGEVLTPEIPEQWHDLYWMGAVAQFIPDYLAVFMGRLGDFASDRRDKTGQRAYRVKMIW